MTNVCSTEEEYEKELKDHFGRLTESSGEEFRNNFKGLCDFLLAHYEAKTIGSKELAYNIAGSLQFKEIKKEPFNSIASLAGELELPDGQISGDPEERFQELLVLIKKL